MNIVDLAILKKMVSGGGGSGTDNYNDLLNLPQINGETLAGNKTAENLGLQDALTFDSTPTEDSTNPVESGGVYSELAKKQDNLTFDGTYDASTNKAATESTVTNAINELDVSATSFDADETISSISETDGKLSVTKQDIAIASNQVVAMTGYAKPSSAPANPAVQTNDTANQAIGKLEFKADTNQTNIWYALNKVGKNLLNFKAWSEAVPVNKGTKTVSDNAITLTATDNDCYTKYGASEYPQDVRIKINPGDVLTLSWDYSAGSSQSDDKVYIFGYNETEPPLSNANVSSQTGYLQYTVPANAKFCTFRLGVTTSGNTATYSNIMICDKAVYDQDSSFQPYGAPNYDLTVREAEDRAALVDVINDGAKNKLDFANITYNSSSYCDYTKTDDSITVTSQNVAVGSRTVYTFDLEAGSYVFRAKITNLTLTNNSALIRILDGSDNILGGSFFTENGIVYFPFNAATTSTYKIMYAPNWASAAYVNTFTASENMICTEADWKISQNYAPHALPNTDLTRMVNDLQKKAVKVYTYHVNPNESDPEDAVTYLDDATGLTPAKMGASSFSYGSWANAWFLPRPCMLKSDGTVAYYLNPNDYSKKTDGTASDIADANFDGNVMLEFPKIWVKRVAGSASGERTVSIAPVNVDGTYKCWSNINAEDKEVDHFYLPAYNGTIHSSKMRSLSGVTLDTTYAPNYTRAQEVTAATANNPSGKNMWYTETWADFCLIYDLLYLMGKSLDVQRTFGQGLSSGAETAMRAYVTGTHNAKGLFYGDVSGTSTAVKVLGMENLWGCRWHGVAGLINDNGTLKVKMTYGVADGSTTVGYNTTGDGYLNYGSTYGTAGYVKKMQADNAMGYKIIETAGTDATYYCDYYYVNNSQSNYALFGGASVYGAGCGFYVNLSGGAARSDWSVGGSLSCRP